VFEAEGVCPVYGGPNGREQALSYARQRAGYGRAEIQVLDESGNVAETINNEDLRPVGVKNVKAYNSIIYMLSVACAGLILNACETSSWPGAATAPPSDSRQALSSGDPTFENDLDRLPNAGPLGTRSSTVSVH
jgi:hypothetical protein